MRRAPNTSTAVMARRIEPPDSLDFFPTPPWATRALCEYVIDPQPCQRVWEPACGHGDMARPLAEYFESVFPSDVHDYSDVFAGQDQVADFLIPWAMPPHFAAHPPEWVITNPPFRLAAEFVLRGLEVAKVGIAVLVRTAFLESRPRYEQLFRDRPPTIMAQFVQRVGMFRGRLDPNCETATAYCWLVWEHDTDVHRIIWIPPCRTVLERPGDYSAAEPAEAGPLFGEVLRQAQDEGER